MEVKPPGTDPWSQEMDSSTILVANRDVRILAPDSEPIRQLT